MMVETRERNERHFHQLSYFSLGNQFHRIILFELIIQKNFFCEINFFDFTTFFGLPGLFKIFWPICTLSSMIKNSAREEKHPKNESNNKMKTWRRREV